MLSIDFEIDDLLGDLEAMIPALDSEVSQALAFGADLIAVEAKQRAPRGPTGQLEASIRALPVLGSFLAGSAQADVIAAAPYASYVEEGTRPHLITARFRRALRFPGAGGFVFAQRVRHPGTEAQPFLEPALNTEADAVADAVLAGIERTLRRYGF